MMAHVAARNAAEQFSPDRLEALAALREKRKPEFED